jgi:hypothetical protein
MKATTASANGVQDRQLVLVRPTPAGQFTAQVVGIPELSATAASREDALTHVRTLLQGWVDSGQLVMVDVSPKPSLLQWFGHADPQDPLEQEYLAELAKAKKEDLERTLKEMDQECSNSCSTPTT